MDMPLIAKASQWILAKPTLKHILQLMAGTASAHLVTLACMPVITRLFPAAELGLLNILMSATTVLSMLMPFSYNHAVPVTKSKVEVRELTKLALFLALAVAGLSLLLIVLVMSFSSLSKHPVFYWVPPCAFLLSAIAIIQNLCFHSSFFSVQARAHLYHAVLNNLSKVSLGRFIPSFDVLALSTLLAYLLKLLVMLRGLKTNQVLQRYRIDWRLSKRSWVVARKFADFPKYRMPQMLVNHMGQHAPVFILAAVGGAAYSAYFGLAVMVLGVPLNLIGSSLYNVVAPQFGRLGRENLQQLVALIRRYSLLLSLVAALPVAVLMVFAPQLFAWIFGEQWGQAGQMCQWLALGYFSMLVSRPAISAIAVLNLQGQFLWFELVSSILKLLAMMVAVLLQASPLTIVAAYSCVAAISYLSMTLFICGFLFNGYRLRLINNPQSRR